MYFKDTGNNTFLLGDTEQSAISFNGQYLAGKKVSDLPDSLLGHLSKEKRVELLTAAVAKGKELAAAQEPAPTPQVKPK